MRIVVPHKAVPDLVEEIELTADGTGIDREYLKFVLNEWDGQALEEALLLKDAGGAEVVAVGLADDPEIDQILYTAAGQGRGRGGEARRRHAPGPPGPAGIARSPTGPRCWPRYLAGHPADLVITGVQAADDPDGQLPPMLAALLDLPHVSVVVSVEADGRARSPSARSSPAAVRTSWRCGLPAVIGVQSARQAPRYAPISRIRQAMQRRRPRRAGGCPPERPRAARSCAGMHQPETTGRAEMLTGERRGGGGPDRGPAPRPWPGERMTDAVSANVMVLAEHTAGQVSDGTHELIGQGRASWPPPWVASPRWPCSARPSWRASSAGPTSWFASNTRPSPSTCRRPTSRRCSTCWRSGPRGCW